METCRTCAKCDFEEETHNWLDLFHPTACNEEIQQIHLEFYHWQLKISQNDGLPQKICTDCFAKFCNVFTFRMCCEKAQMKLNNIFDKIETQSINDNEQYLEDFECSERFGLDDEHFTEANATKTATPTLTTANENDVFLFDILHTNETISLNGNNNAKTTTNTTTTNNNSYNKQLTNSNNNNNNNNKNDIDIANNNHFNNNNNELLPTINPNEVSTYTAPTIKQANNNNNYDQFITVNATTDITTLDKQPELTNISSDQTLLLLEVKTDKITTIVHTALDSPDQLVNQNECKGESEPLISTFDCKYCYKTNEQHFTTQQQLLAHIATTHANEKYPFTCPNCCAVFQDAASRTVHMKSAHVSKQFKCQVCGKRYADRFNLRHHIEKFHSDQDFECKQCEKRFYSRKSLNYHMKWHIPELQLKCGYCDRLFINQRHLKCHEATHTGVRNSECCQFCGKSFIHLKTLRLHIYKQHGGEKPFKCGNCPEAFASYREKRIHMLEFHLENLTANEKTECMLCHGQYENEIELRQHMQTEHQPKRKLQPIISNNKRVLQHKSEKHYSGLFQCEICSQRFNMKRALERHAAVHSTEGRPHACPHCSKRFKRLQDMNWHIKTHSNEKPNVCDVCGKGFALKYVLTQHKRSHEVLEKNFICHTCGRSYLFEKSLRMHERIHTGETYYKCDLCSESFVTHIKFKCHLRKVHNDNDSSKNVSLDKQINIVIT